jgi:hypothetical protein
MVRLPISPFPQYVQLNSIIEELFCFFRGKPLPAFSGISQAQQDGASANFAIPEHNKNLITTPLKIVHILHRTTNLIISTCSFN